MLSRLLTNLPLKKENFLWGGEMPNPGHEEKPASHEATVRRLTWSG